MTLLLEWLSREGHLLLAWWLWITLAGMAAFPLCLRLFGALPDHGYTIARTLGTAAGNLGLLAAGQLRLPR